MSVIDTIKKLVDEFNNSIKDTMAKKRLDDTGNASSSLRTEIEGRHVRSKGVDYIEYLDRGRGPGKFPPIEKIRRWVRSKLNIEDNGVAYVISRKIAREGTTIFKNPKKGLEIDDKIEVLRGKLKKEVAASYKAEVVRKIKGRL